MKALLLSLFITGSAFAEIAPPHIGPEGGRFNNIHALKIERMIQNRIASEKDAQASEEDRKIEMLLAVGKRASQWITKVNTVRTPETKLDLSSPSKSGGIPITEPQKSSTEIMMKRYEDFLKSTSPLITDVVTSSRELPVNPPVEDAEFVKSLRVLDRIYQSTIRWAGARQWLAWYINRSIYDIRGFIFLKGTPDLENTLKAYKNLSTEDQAKFSGWLLGLCRNGDFEMSDCRAELTKAVSKNTLFDFYNRFNKYGQSMYDLLFTIKATRPEIFWNTAKTQLISPFKTPERADVTAWLKENVEDEWKFDAFNLIIDYKKTTADIPRIQFKEGVTANVNGIAGNLITMEAEYPIESRDQKWTIRHEYGHVLGFQDCYLEFYDTNEKAIIYYEIDVDNLMCSRNGHLKETHVTQLKKAYK
nr:hypothetical protein BHI3_16270 [Bacteriovorax sp. HI3]